MDNMFEKANKERRKKVIEKNIGVADEVLQSGKDKKENFLLEKQDKKIRRTISIDKSVDQFYNELCKITGMNRSELIGSILEIAIEDSDEIKELAHHNERVRDLIEEYFKA